MAATAAQEFHLPIMCLATVVMEATEDQVRVPMETVRVAKVGMAVRAVQFCPIFWAAPAAAGITAGTETVEMGALEQVEMAEMVETEEQNLIPVALPVLGEMVQAGMVPTAEMALAEMAEKAASVAMLSLMGFLQAMEDKADREAPDTVETALEMLV